MLSYDIIESYVEKVYGFAVNRTYSQEEAEELTQEILFTVIHRLPSLKDESKFEPWLWGIAGNISKSFRRNISRQRAIYTYDVSDDLFYEDVYSAEQEEIFDSLRTKIAMLSATYRNIIILYYYDGLSTKQISQKLNIPEGTITWRLSEARRKLQKECCKMTETALRPVVLNLNIFGEGNYNGKSIPLPTAYIDDALSQNILYNCYEKPQTVEDLANLCGVPAYYIEDRIQNLINRDAMIEPVKGKFQTNFIIFSDKHGIYCEENAEKLLMPILDKMIIALKNIAAEAGKIDFYKAEKSESDLFYLYCMKAFLYARRKHCKLPKPTISKKYDGYRFGYVGSVETGNHPRIGTGRQRSSTFGRHGSFSHTTFYSINGIEYRQMMYDYYIDACIDILINGSSNDTYNVANAIRDGYIIKRDDGIFFVTVPFFTMEQNEIFNTIAEKYLAPLMIEYSEILDSFIAGYKKLFPTHLYDSVDYMCREMFLGMLNVILKHAQDTGKTQLPTPGSYCEVLTQCRKPDPKP